MNETSHDLKQYRIMKKRGNPRVKEQTSIKSLVQANAIGIIIGVAGIILALIGIGVTIALANGSFFTAEITFNENDTNSVIRIDPKSGTVKCSIELLQGTDGTTYRVYYKRGWESSYTLGQNFYYLNVGQYEGPHNLFSQTGWRNWDIKTVQTNNLSSTTYKIFETIKLD